MFYNDQQTKPSLDTLEKIASALNVPITDLFECPKQNIITCPKCGTALEIKANTILTTIHY